MPRALALLLASALVASGLSACGGPDRDVVALLLASDASPRWTQSDEPSFHDRLSFLCADCTYLYKNAQGDSGTQAAQLRAVLDDGADVVVLNAVSAEDGEALVTQAQAAGAEVVAYDRFVAGADFYVSYDAGAIGRQMARAVVERVPDDARVLLVNGAQTDANGVAIKKAVHGVLDRSGVTVVDELDPQTWSAEEAGGWLRGQLDRHPAAGIDAIIAANDVQAGGIAQTLQDLRVPRADWPVVTGQDADLEALQRIVAGAQTLTVFKSFPREAVKAADIAAALVRGQQVKGARELEGVASFVFQPLVVSVDNLTDTVVRDGIYTIDQLCPAALLEDCTRLGVR